MKTLWGYGRASTHEQQETLLGQQSRIEKEFEHRFKEEGLAFGGVFLDPGVSGSVPLSNRPQGLRLCQSLNEGDVVMICKLDRGFRNCADLIKTMELWSQRDIRLVAIDQNLDTGSPAGRMFVKLLAVFAEFEREMMCERMSDMHNSLKARGLYPYPNPPWGFVLKEKKLYPNHEQRRLGAAIVELVDLRKMTFEEIYWHFRRNQVKRTDGTELACRSINRYYKWEMALRLAEAKAQAEGKEEPRESNHEESSG